MQAQDGNFRGRRRFLRQAVTAAGSGVLVLWAAGRKDGGRPPAQPGNAVADASAARGYRVTDHIRSYYATLRS